MNRLLLKGKIFVLMLLAMGAATSCNDDDDDEDTMLTLQSFMQQAAESDLFEITTGGFATQKGVMTEVKTFGQMLVNDHTTSSNELKTLATQKSVTISMALPQDKTAKATLLQNASGTAFDKLFSEMQVQAHEEAIDLYEKADRDITDTQVQAFIDKTLPVLRMHLTEAERLEDMTD